MVLVSVVSQEVVASSTHLPYETGTRENKTGTHDGGRHSVSDPYSPGRRAVGVSRTLLTTDRQDVYGRK